MKKEIVSSLIMGAIIGFVLGALSVIFALSNTESTEITRLIVEIEDKEEIIYQLNLENERLEGIINSITIEDRQIAE